MGPPESPKHDTAPETGIARELGTLSSVPGAVELDKPQRTLVALPNVRIEWPDDSLHSVTGQREPVLGSAALGSEGLEKFLWRELTVCAEDNRLVKENDANVVGSGKLGEIIVLRMGTAVPLIQPWVGSFR